MRIDFEEIYNTYKDMVYNFVYWKVKDHEDALDLSQEIFLKVYKNLKSFREESSLKTWIMKIAINHVKDFFKAKRNFTMEVPSDDEDQEMLPELVLDDFTSIEDEILVERALSNLKEWEKEILVLYYMEGFEYHEIAEILGIPIGTVKSRLNAAKKSLKRVIFGGVTNEK